MKSKPHEVRPLHVQIPNKLHGRLKRMAEARDRSVSAETRRALERRVKEFEAEEAAA